MNRRRPAPSGACPLGRAILVSKKGTIMTALILMPVMGAIGFSLIYLLLGGGLGGAVLIFIVAKMFGK
jgi:hypothetical protein